jgi:hypothetical protein
MNTRLFAVPVLFLALAASAGEFFYETMADWVVISAGGRSFFARRADFDPAYARMSEGRGKEPEFIRVHGLQYDDTGPEGSIQAMKATVTGQLKISSPAEGGVAMEVSVPGGRRMSVLTGAVRLVPSRENAPLRGGWERRIRVSDGSGKPLFNSPESLIESLPLKHRAQAIALRDGMPGAFQETLRAAYAGKDVLPALEAVTSGYLKALEDGNLAPKESGGRDDREPRVDVWGSLLPYERAVLMSLPDRDRDALRHKIAQPRDRGECQPHPGSRLPKPQVEQCGGDQVDNRGDDNRPRQPHQRDEEKPAQE